jgi:DNA-directed RNA polymerase subunit RPC12/RpoP
MLTECDNCAGFSICEYNVPFYRDPRHTAPDGIRWFCSPECKRVYFKSSAERVFECADCNRVYTDEFRWTVVCPPCYGRRLLKTGQPPADFEDLFYHAHMPSNRWISDAEIAAAGYTRVATICNHLMEINALAKHTLACNVGAAILAQPITAKATGNNVVVYARPSPRRAQSAILTLYTGWRFDKGSTLGRLPRDLIGLLATAIWATRVDKAWLNV